MAGYPGGRDPRRYAEPLKEVKNTNREQAMEIAHDVLMNEFDNLTHDPADYLRSMGWDPEKYKDADWRDADWDQSDTERLADALTEAFNRSTDPDPLEALIDAIGRVSDITADIVASSIMALIPN